MNYAKKIEEIKTSRAIRSNQLRELSDAIFDLFCDILHEEDAKNSDSLDCEGCQSCYNKRENEKYFQLTDNLRLTTGGNCSVAGLYYREYSKSEYNIISSIESAQTKRAVLSHLQKGLKEIEQYILDEENADENVKKTIERINTAMR